MIVHILETMYFKAVIIELQLFLIVVDLFEVHPQMSKLR